MVVSRDVAGRVITTILAVTPSGLSHELVYLGSPFLPYPIRQPGTLIFSNANQVDVLVAYDLTTDRVSLRLRDSTEVQSAEPDEFTVEQRHFIRLSASSGRTFYQVLYAGKTQFLTHYRTQLYSRISQGGSYSTSPAFRGEYKTSVDYYIQPGSQPPHLIRLTKKALASVFRDVASQPGTATIGERLTELDAINILQQHDYAQQNGIPPN